MNSQTTTINQYSATIRNCDEMLIEAVLKSKSPSLRQHIANMIRVSAMRDPSMVGDPLQDAIFDLAEDQMNRDIALCDQHDRDIEQQEAAEEWL